MSNIVPVFIAGGAAVHAGRKVGQYPSGAVRYRKLCGARNNERHEPSPITDLSTPITCKRCLAKLERTS